MTAIAQSAYNLLFRSRFSDDDRRRQEFILNVVLCGSLAISLVAFTIVLVNSLLLGSAYVGESPGMAVSSVAFFAILVLLSRMGHYVMSAYTIVFLYIFLGFYALARWGISLTEGTLVLAAALVMASIILGSRVGAVLTAMSAVGLVTLAQLQQLHRIPFNAQWMKTPGDVSDAIAFSATLAIITTISWLSNREIARSMKRARRSEAELTRERDSLEVKVKERTRELELAQRAQVMQLSRFAEFGRLTSGIVHELVSPLTTVAINLEQMHDEDGSEKLRRAVASTKRMERYIEAARKQLQNQTDRVRFAPDDEIRSALDFLAPLAKDSHVELVFHSQGEAELSGSPIKFNQLITNLAANAVGSYPVPAHGGSGRRVTVEKQEDGDLVRISVHDRGSGIPPAALKQIFEPFYSLKSPEEGMGLGLSLCKEIVEGEFGGSIAVASSPRSGTLFTVELPTRRRR